MCGERVSQLHKQLGREHGARDLGGKARPAGADSVVVEVVFEQDVLTSIACRLVAPEQPLHLQMQLDPHAHPEPANSCGKASYECICSVVQHYPVVVYELHGDPCRRRRDG